MPDELKWYNVQFKTKHGSKFYKALSTYETVQKWSTAKAIRERSIGVRVHGAMRECISVSVREAEQQEEFTALATIIYLDPNQFQ